MVGLHIGVVGQRAFLDMVQKLLGGKQLAAPFTALQRMASDHVVPDTDGADIVRVGHRNNPGGAEVGAGAASDTRVPCRLKRRIFSSRFNSVKPASVMWALSRINVSKAAN